MGTISSCFPISRIEPLQFGAMSYRTRSLDDMPEDIWIDIIKSYITNYDVKLPYMDVDKLLPLTLVSRNWDLRIRTIPTLWTDIVICNDTIDVELKVASCLHFSQNALIGLYFVNITDSWGRLSSRFAFERSRISSIFIAETVGHFLSDKIRPLLAGLSPLPALKSLRCAPECHFMLGIEQFESSPMLSNVEGCFIRPIELEKIPQTVQTLCADMAPGNFLPSIGGLNYLKSVSFFYPGSTVLHEYPTSIKDGDLRWRSLVCYWLGNQSHLGLLNRLRCSLVNLTLALHVDEWLIELLRSLGGFSQLRYCEIDVRGQNTDRMVSTSSNEGYIGPLCPATKLNFSISVRDIDGKQVESMASALQVSFPMVEELEISGRDYEHAFYFLLGRGFPKLTSLSLDFSFSYNARTFSNQIAIKTPASLSSLTTTQFPKEALASFMSPGIKKVDHHGRTYETKVSQFNEWTGLHSLKVSTPPHMTYWDGFSSHSLCRLIYHEKQESNRVIHHFAAYPLSCPLLEYLEIHSTPDWDIFFIMLERRNLLHRDEVSSLKEIVLPDLCPRYLRSPIRQLLQRQPAMRPSYYNLSRQRIWEDLQDPKVPGCTTCLLALRFCEVVLYPTVTSHPQEISSEYIAYPSDTNEILSTRLARQGQLPSVQGREYSCSKWMTPSLIAITQEYVEETTCEWGEKELLQFLYPEDLVITS